MLGETRSDEGAGMYVVLLWGADASEVVQSGLYCTVLYCTEATGCSGRFSSDR